MYDLFIKDALIYDGTGKESFYGSVAVSDGKIEAVFRKGELTESAVFAKEVIDAKGLSLAPGFIDSHSHSDLYFSFNPERDFVLKQGITTEIGGNCGHSITPVPEGLSEDELFGAIGNTCPHGKTYTSFSEALEDVKKMPVGPNQKWFTGHGNLRTMVMGIENRAVSEDEIKQMGSILQSTMPQGSLGLSTGLAYVPGIYSNTYELVELCKFLGAYNGMYCTHSRSESAGFFDCIKECIEIAEKAKVPVEISHFKLSGKDFWPNCKTGLEMIDEANRNGAKITLDCYPYTAVSTTCLSAIPPQYLDEGPEALAKRLEDENFVNQLRKEIYEIDDPSWDNAALHVGLENFYPVTAEWTPWILGKSYAESAKEMGLSPFDGWVKLIHDNHGKMTDVRFTMSEENVEMIYKHPTTVVCTDGIYKKGAKMTHPRALGSFPRYLGRYIRQREILSREEGIRRMTGLPADRFKLNGKGYIKPGFDADFVLFDYDNIIDHATYDNPFQDAEGIEKVIMEGKVIIDRNKETGIYVGKYL